MTTPELEERRMVSLSLELADRDLPIPRSIHQGMPLVEQNNLLEAFLRSTPTVPGKKIIPEEVVLLPSGRPLTRRQREGLQAVPEKFVADPSAPGTQTVRWVDGVPVVTSQQDFGQRQRQLTPEEKKRESRQFQGLTALPEPVTRCLLYTSPSPRD